MQSSRPSTLLISALVFVACVTQSTAIASPQTPRDPAISEGVRLHDAGQYDKAIAKYREALTRDPGNVSALYELALSYHAKKDYSASLEAAEAGTRFAHPLRPALYMLIGTVRDDQGDGAGAIAAYRAGIREDPRVPLLHLNLGVTFLRQEKWREARLALEQALVLKPDHASAHYYLAYAYEKEAFKVPALLALTRFLLLEPGPDRSKEALSAMDRLFAVGYKREADTGNATLTLSPEGSREEGNFASADLGMLMAQAASSLPEEPTPAGVQVPPTVKRLSDTIAIAVETADADSHGFASDYYLPYFKAINGGDRLTVASYVALQASELPAVRDWLTTHKKEADAFRTWSAAFAWPRLGVHP